MSCECAFGDVYLVRTSGIWGKLVRYWTRSRYSHGGIVIWNNKGVEATWRGVRVVDLSRYDNVEVAILTPVDPLSSPERRELAKFLMSSLKTDYDYGALLGFIFFKQKWADPRKFYCFELINEAYKSTGREILRLDNEYVDGSLLYSSLAFDVRK